MEHKEYKRIVNGAKTAVLFIHGIIGTPNHFKDFLPLIPDNISVHNILLRGHGKGVKDFSQSSMRKWEEQVEKAVEELSACHEKIIVIAHSMGTLFAIEQGVKNDKITDLFLIAVPIKLFIRAKMFTNVLKVFFNKIKLDDKIALAAKNCCGITLEKNIFKYLGWIPPYLGLFGKIHRTRKILPMLKTSCTAYQSYNDEMVSLKSVEYLRSKSSMNVVELENSGHYYYEDEDLKLMLRDFEKVLFI